jgi:threonine dehydrogenase-like Zn-dependent dehydrogenase
LSARDDERTFAIGEQLREVAAHRHQILRRMTHEAPFLVFAVGQVEPNDGGDEVVSAPNLGCGERAGKVRIEFVITEARDLLDPKTAPGDESAPPADLR